MILVVVVGAVLAGVAVGLLVRALSAGRIRHQELLAQVGSYGFSAVPITAGLERPQLQEALSKFATWVGSRFEQQLDEERRRRIRAELNMAGFYRTSVARYMGYRVLCAVGLPALLLILLIVAGSFSAPAVVFVLVLALAGFMAPSIYLDRRTVTRARKIDYEIPELVDLLVTTVEAGVGFLAALQTAARRVREPLGQELRVTLREQGMGISLDGALRNLGTRTNSANLRMFVQAVIQGETLGVSIGKILRDLAVDMRKARRQMAEERAQKAPIKLLFPLVFLILPAMMMVLLGPALYAVVKQLGA
jgi:tight adherence protein C